MSDQDDRDLSSAFEELRAPRSTANYADRVPSVEAVETVYARRWPQALATVLAVLVALGGAGTFLALRNARQGGVGSSAGYPSARSNAAMAFDSTSGQAVMFGGTSASGSTLADTWTWNGSSWATWTGPSPGKLINPHMSDDPADGGLLLIGLPQPANQGNGIACAVGGSGGGVTGTSTGTSVAPGTPAASNGPTSVSRPPVKSGSSLATPPPEPSGSPITACPIPVPSPTLQTWLFTSTGWTHVAGAPAATLNADTPSDASQLAYDSTSGEVIAVSTSAFGSCGPPLRSGATVEPDLICPLAGSAGQSGSSGAQCNPAVCTSSSFPCREGAVVNNCLPFAGSISTWTWAHGTWTQRKGAIIPNSNTGVVFSDAASSHATLVTEATSFTSPCIPVGAPCPAVPPAMTSEYTWAGSAWSQSAATQTPTSGVSLAGATVASAHGHTIVLTPSGQLYVWSATDGAFVQEVGAPQPDGRMGAAMAEGPGGSIVLFGGIGISTKAGSLAIGGARAPGADTWTWNGSSWRHVAGPAPPVTTPSPCSDVTGLGSDLCARPPTVPPVSAPSSAAPKPTVPIGA
jgi:hypothetical protein